jgi:4-hydroxybenzoate polyprenyltransferase
MNFNILIKTIRLNHLYKNFLVLIPYFIFPELKIDLSLAIVFLILCLLSSVCYMINDIVDATQDKLLAHKKNSPLQTGKVTIHNLILLILLFSLLIIFLLYTLNFNKIYLIHSLVFLVSSILYSFISKRIVIFDLVTLAINYAIRTVFVLSISQNLDLFFGLFLFFAAYQASNRLALIRKFSHLGYSKSKSMAYSGNDSIFLQSLYLVFLFLSIGVFTKFQTNELIFTFPVIILMSIYNYYSWQVGFETNINKRNTIFIFALILISEIYYLCFDSFLEIL